jgi:hypothetical protein
MLFAVHRVSRDFEPGLENEPDMPQMALASPIDAFRTSTFQGNGYLERQQKDQIQQSRQARDMTVLAQRADLSAPSESTKNRRLSDRAQDAVFEPSEQSSDN